VNTPNDYRSLGLDKDAPSRRRRQKPIGVNVALFFSDLASADGHMRLFTQENLKMSKTTAEERLAAIEKHAEAIHSLLHRRIGQIVEIGKHLIEIKELLPHGEWQP
jgi:hypothetical protein